MSSSANEALIQEFIGAMRADDKAHVLRLISDDCTWLVVPWGYTASGYEEVAAFLGVAQTTRTHETAKGQHIEINGWFTDGEHLCMEITNIASLSWLKSVKAAQRICLVLHMKNGRFDRVHEYFKAPFPISLIIRLVPLVARMRLRRQKRRLQSMGDASNISQRD
jgi:ketosteroid isomerase-like protein